MDAERSYDLAVKLGYDESCTCVVNHDSNGEETFWWNGLQIPSGHVHLVRYDNGQSGRYPWYLTLANERGIDLKEYGL